MNTFTQQKCIFYPLFCIGFFIVLSFFLLPDYSHAATEQISLIRQDCTGYTGCYTSLSAWQTAQVRNLVASNEIAVAQIDGAWTLPDTTPVIISGWTTDATHYIKIYTTAAARHTGKWDDTKYRLENGNWGVHIIDNQQNFTTIEGVQILHSGGGSSSSGIYSVDFAGVIVKDSIVKKSSTITGQGIMVTGTPIASSGVVNSIAYGGWDQGIDVAAHDGYGYAYNTTSYGNNFGYNGFYIQNLKNCIGASNTIADFARTGTYAVNTTTCASSGPTANTFTDTGSRINQTFSFIDPLNEDFHLQSTDTAAKDFGTTLSTDSIHAFATDIDGQTRTAPWDIGADEVSGGTPPAPAPDTTSPSIPTGLSATAVSSTQINLSWTASTDNIGVTGYTIYKGGVQVATSPASTYSDTALSAATAYTYTISAYDAANNASAQSPSASATTQAVQVIITTSGAPVLNFSDIISGPKIGNTDGLGSGAIVSIWGNNLGGSQGASQIYVSGIPAAHVYYWGNADGNKDAGPADLYAVQKMQTISFSIPATAVDGANTIYVTVGGQQSNTLPFTVRTGNIYFVKTTGSDSAGNGSWNNPLRTMVYVGDGSGNAGAGGKVKAGDIVYIGDGVTESQGLPIKYIDGTPSMPVSLIAYPGAQVVILGPSGYGIGPHMHASAFWNFSKLTIKTTGDGIDTFRGMRAVANEITNYPGAYANGQGGAITGDNYNFPLDPAHDIVSGIKNFGNYIHDFGGPTTDKLHHIFYISNRGGLPAEAFELGWNYIRDNGAYHALHVYDEGRCGDFTGTIKIHDNVVKNQVGVGFGVSSGGSATCISAPINVYNNLFINVGAKFSGTDSYHSYAIGMSGSYTKSHVRIYNNTFYGFSDATAVDPAFFPDMSNAMGPFGGTWEFVNNIVINTNNVPYRSTNGGFAFVNPALATNNIWYSPGGTQPSPSWETNQITTNPLFINLTLSDLHLQSASPAIDTGSSLVSAIVTRDLNGNPRPQGSSWDIGAYEYISSYTPPSDTIVPTTITNLSISNIGQISLTLSWTAPSDSSGVSSYDIRYNTSLITDATFPTSTQVSSIPVPSVPDTVQQLYISIGLTPGTTYYFAIKSTDSARNVSQLSNIPSATTLSAPSAQSGTVSIPSSGAGSGGGSAIYQVSGSQVPASPSHIQINPTNIQISSSSIQEGSLIRGPDHIKVYIVNAYGYKRHIFNSAVFNMYGHFKWDQIRDIDQGTLNAYQTSDLYRADGDAKVFSLKELDESKGLAQKRWFNLSGNAFLQKGYTFNQVFIINSKERDYYQEGTPITDNAATLTLPALVKIKDNPQIYFISDKGIKKPILNEVVFNSYKSNRWQDVKEISQAELDQYTAFQGILYQGRVYTINLQAQTKQLVENPDAFNQLNLDWSKIMPVNEVEMKNWK